jgi:RHS repeat-associated protein
VVAFLSFAGAGNVLAAATVTYYYSDPQGTVLATADAAGMVVATNDYRPYGSPSLGAPRDGPSYHGAFSDTDDVLIYMMARYYDPDTGRFVSVDPQATEMNQYSYASNNPVAMKDSTGLYTCTASSDVCDKVEKALQEIRSAAAAKQTTDRTKGALLNVLKAYGTKNDGNRVAITGDASSSPASTTHNDDGSTSVNFDLNQLDEIIGPNGPGYDNNLEFASAVVHEGQHLADPRGGMFDPSKRTGVELREKHAFTTQGFFNESVRNISAWHLWRPGISPDQMRDAAQINGQAAADAICKQRHCE